MKCRNTVRVAAATVAVVAAVFGWAHWPTSALAVGARADRVVVVKSARRLELRADGRLLKAYEVSLGRSPVGPKLHEGDGRTPEGVYSIALHWSGSSCHRALGISYPSAADRAAAGTRGEAPGGDIMIHGLRNGFGWLGRLHRCMDWTAGCIAVTNTEIEEICRVVPDGTRVEIRP